MVKSVNSHIDRLPQVITRDRNCFYEFIKNIVEYVNNSSNEIYKINKITSDGLNNITNIPYLQRLCELLDIKLRYASKSGFDATTYIAAINGIALVRNLDGSKQSIINFLNAVYGGNESADVIDGGLTDLDNNAMSYVANVNNYVKGNTEILASYFKPQLTGVEEQFKFKSKGYFTSMKTKQETIGEVTKITELQSDSNEYKDFNGSLNWMDYDIQRIDLALTETFGINEVEDNPVDIELASNMSAYTGKWIAEII